MTPIPGSCVPDYALLEATVGDLLGYPSSKSKPKLDGLQSSERDMQTGQMQTGRPFQRQSS